MIFFVKSFFLFSTCTISWCPLACSVQRLSFPQSGRRAEKRNSQILLLFIRYLNYETKSQPSLKIMEWKNCTALGGPIDDVARWLYRFSDSQNFLELVRLNFLYCFNIPPEFGIVNRLAHGTIELTLFFFNKLSHVTQQKKKNKIMNLMKSRWCNSVAEMQFIYYKKKKK